MTADAVASPRRIRLRWAALVAGGAALSLVLLVAEPFTVRSSSMSPTLHDGDQVLVEKLSPRFGDLARGDVIVFEAPGTHSLMVKRVVALAGDRVGLADGRLVVNGRRVDEPYVDLEAVDGVYFGPDAVPHGAVFVMGDDRGNSVDSRTFGAVSLRSVVGRVLVKLP